MILSRLVDVKAQNNHILGVNSLQIRFDELMKLCITHLKTILVVGILLCGLILCFVYFQSEEVDPVDMIASFQKAVLTEDLQTLKELIQSEDERLPITSEDLKRWVGYCKEHPRYFTKLMDNLYAQHALITHQINYYSERLGNTSKQEMEQAGDFYLQKKEGLFGDSYQIVVRPKFIQLQVDNDEAIVNIHGQEYHLKRGEAKKIGPLFPGVYQANGKAKFSYANTTVQKKWDIDLLAESKQTILSHEQMTGQKITIDAKYPRVRLYANGQKTPLISEGEPNQAKVDFYPVTKQPQKVYGELQLPWGTARTNLINIDPGALNATYEFSLYPLINQQIEHSLTLEIERLARAIERVYNHRPVDQMKQTTFTSYNVFSGDKKPFLTYIENIVSAQSIKSGTLKTMEIFRLPKLDEQHHLIIPVHLTFNQNRDGGAKEEQDFYEVRLKYQQKKWQVVHVHELPGYPIGYQEQKSIQKKY